MQLFILRYQVILRKATYTFLLFLMTGCGAYLLQDHIYEYQVAIKEVQQFAKIESKLKSDLTEAYSVLNGDSVILERDSKRYLIVTQVSSHLEENYKDHMELLK